MKRCSGCRETKPLDQFHRHSGRPDGRQTYCIDCNLAQHAERRADEDWALARRCKRYGITVQEYRALEEQQQGQCAICHELMGTPYIDHCHTGGQVRGLLCSRCNAGLGQFRDEPMLLLRAIWYLENVGGQAFAGLQGGV